VNVNGEAPLPVDFGGSPAVDAAGAQYGAPLESGGADAQYSADAQYGATAQYSATAQYDGRTLLPMMPLDFGGSPPPLSSGGSPHVAFSATSITSGAFAAALAAATAAQPSDVTVAQPSDITAALPLDVTAAQPLDVTAALPLDVTVVRGELLLICGAVGSGKLIALDCPPHLRCRGFG
jgi:hypothetical protein